MTLGAGASALLLFWPVHVEVLGIEGTCGPAVLTVFQEPNGELEQLCRSQGGDRAFEASLLFAVTVLIGAGLIVADDD